jgi:hypothetical protein
MPEIIETGITKGMTLEEIKKEYPEQYITALETAVKEKNEEIIRLKGSYDDAIGEYRLEEQDLRKQIAALKDEIDHPKRTYCAYCGFTIEIDDEGATKIGEHIATCEKHPMRQLEEQIAALIAELNLTQKKIKEIFNQVREWECTENASDISNDDKHEYRISYLRSVWKILHKDDPLMPKNEEVWDVQLY